MISVKLLIKFYKMGKNLNIYNIGTTEVVKIKKIILILEKIFQIKVKIENTPLKKGGTKIRCPNINKIKQLGFKQKISLREGLEQIIKLN